MQFKDFTTVANDLGRNYSKNTENETVKMNNIIILKGSKYNIGYFYYKTSYSQEDFKMIKSWTCQFESTKNQLHI